MKLLLQQQAKVFYFIMYSNSTSDNGSADEEAQGKEKKTVQSVPAYRSIVKARLMSSAVTSSETCQQTSRSFIALSVQK